MSNIKRSEPQRSCIACRSTKHKKNLLRFVLAPDTELVPDLEQKLPGHGAYTCISRSCLLEAGKKRQFSRAFKTSAITVNYNDLATLVEVLMQKRVAGYLSLANKAGKLMSGGESLESALRSTKPPKLLLLACDASQASAKKLTAAAQRSGLPVFSVFDKDLLGQLTGKHAERAAVAIMSAEFACSIKNELERYRSYLEEESSR